LVVTLAVTLVTPLLGADKHKMREAKTDHPEYYNEVYDSNGNVRPQYRDIVPIMEQVSPRRYQ